MIYLHARGLTIYGQASLSENIVSGTAASADLHDNRIY
jgi:hypothetical protein